MAFNTALSGLKAASKDLGVIGNDIANASTIGFKESRAEFGDVYAATVFSSGSNQIGSGVNLTKVSQQFVQGSVSFTNNGLDLAVNGGGFFILSDDGEISYTRNGIMLVDKEGYIVNNSSQRLQGFAASETGAIGGALIDLQVEAENLAPEQTTEIVLGVNLDARESPPVIRGTTVEMLGGDIANAVLGSSNGYSTNKATTVTSEAASIGIPQAGANNGYSAETATFTTSTGTVTVNTSANDSASIIRTNINSAFPNGEVTATGTTTATLSNLVKDTLANTMVISINGQTFTGAEIDSLDNLESAIEINSTLIAQGISSSLANGVLTITSSVGDDLDIQVTAGAATDTVNVTGGSTTLNLFADGSGDGTQATIGGNLSVLMEEGITLAGTGAIFNAVPTVTQSPMSETEVLTVTDDEGGTTTVTTTANQTALALAQTLSSLTGVSASSSTHAIVNGFGNGGTFALSLNGTLLTGITPSDLADSINQLSTNGGPLQGISAQASGLDLTVSAQTGINLTFELASGAAGDTVTIQGQDDDGQNQGSAVTVTGADTDRQVTVGGVLTVTLDDGYTLTSDNTNATGVFDNNTLAVSFIDNQFDPLVAASFNSATQITVFDSLGNPHISTFYFVKEDTPNTWSVYVQVGGEDVGDPNTSLPPPDNVAPTRAQFTLAFQNDGSIDPIASDQILISYWNPVDANGNNNGALQGLPVVQGGTLPIPNPPTSSNFFIDLSNSSQFGSTFSVNQASQNGFTTGRLASIDVAEDGSIFSRFSNGQSQLLGVVALANFPNVQGLKPNGNTQWVETFDSGNPVLGTPGSGSLGVIQSGALEESNVELSQELVNLIIAQRNFQANAQTIQTADAVTQTIINLR